MIGRILFLAAALAVACLLGIFASPAGAQTPPPPPPPTDTLPPPPPPPDPIPDPPQPSDDSGGGGSSSGSSSSSGSTSSSYTPAPTITKSHPAKTTQKPPPKKHHHKKPAPPPIIKTHDPRDLPVWATEPTKSAAAAPAFFRAPNSDTGAFLARLVAGGALLVALLLLLVAAIPDWVVVRSERAALILAHWRVQIAATGLSALSLAAIVFLLTTSAL